MSSNYPPGVAGAEPQIAGYPEEAAPTFRVEVLDPTARRESWVGNGLTFKTLDEAWAHAEQLIAHWIGPHDARIMRGDDPVPWAVYSCSGCAPFIAGGLAPSHRGSRNCESGSLASGGTIAHCTCDVCF